MCFEKKKSNLAALIFSYTRTSVRHKSLSGPKFLHHGEYIDEISQMDLSYWEDMLQHRKSALAALVLFIILFLVNSPGKINVRAITPEPLAIYL